MGFTKNILIAVSASALFASVAMAQQSDVEVDVKGIGMKRDDALQDAMRNAVGQAMGVALTSETKVENFVVIEDAIETRTEGYITTYNVTKEAPFPDRFEISIHAKVNLSPLKADIKALAQSVGGIRFLVAYDPRNVPADEIANYDLAVERINGYLASKKYRYIEKKRFDQLKKESANIARESGSTEESYVQHLGITADAQFIIFISNISVATKSEAFDTRTSKKVNIEAKAYDNCTAEGLGTVVLASDWKSSQDMNSAVSDAVKKGFDSLLYTFTSYIGDWANNGTPFELRFYSSGSYRDMRDLRTKMKDDKSFAGQLEVVSLDNYTKINCNFKKKPDELADRVLDIADEIPAFKEKRMDVKFIYGRQVSFAPHNVTPPDLPVAQQQEQQQTTPATTEPKKETAPAKTTTTVPARSGASKKTTTPQKKTVTKSTNPK
jgi:hypothetical protein